ncbi:M23 family metallopeptidase [Qipengyuania sp. 6B39]|uniref:M23 family metallopeptidase n=1 Tax=Qipengyuania proteolytica TaxID=2867239 RepID=UPI001C88FE98|nr:M23 family metallopeptidase [Qipengyuania proteolytica]MBX7495014.1 M23 family metallopeptidase [Qipengyuania proteolytica]
MQRPANLLKCCAFALLLGAPAASGARDGEGGVPPLAASAASVSADVMTDEVPLEDYDEPVIVFGKAVDLAGTDIEPGHAGLSPGLVGLPSGRPLAAARISSGYGMRYHPVLGGNRFHAGVDLVAATGTPVAATSAGRVTTAGWSGNYGILVAISHGGSVETRYAHLSAVAVRAGETVKQGQVIGYVGSTGRSTGPHLHYETRVGGRAANPASSW